MNFDIADLNISEGVSGADGGLEDAGAAADTDETRTAGKKNSFTGKGWRGSVMNLPVSFNIEEPTEVPLDASPNSGSFSSKGWRGSVLK